MLVGRVTLTNASMSHARKNEGQFVSVILIRRKTHCLWRKRCFTSSWCNTLKLDKLRRYLTWWKCASCVCLASRLFVLCLLCFPNHPLVQSNAPLHGARQHVHILNKATDDCYWSSFAIDLLLSVGALWQSCPHAQDGTSVLQNFYKKIFV